MRRPQAKLIHDMTDYPTLIAHADWGSAPGKRWLARAKLTSDGRYCVMSPARACALDQLLSWLAEEGGRGPVLIGFDFPIGLPQAFAERVGIGDFLEALPRFGHGEWIDFYAPAESAHEIGLHRPFYPHRPGGTRRQHLLDGLGMATGDALWRRCDRLTFGRGAPSPLFWTLGPNQSGKAAIVGWRDVLAPALRAGCPRLAIWPFAGSLADSLRPGWVVAAETYPAECYHHLGLADGGKRWSKRRQADRAAQAPHLLAWAAAAEIELAPALVAAIRDGFGPQPDGDDPFDAVVGLFGMLKVVLGRRPPGDPDDEMVRRVEGWILGQVP